MNKWAVLLLMFAQALFCQDALSTRSQTCQFIQGLQPTEGIWCGRISVPEDHGEPEGKKILLSFAVLPARDTTAKAHPMIFLSGGPGGASLSPDNIGNWLNNPIREDRAIILLDQRGIGYSSGLPNMHKELYNIFAKNADMVEEHALMKALIHSYKLKCKAQNIHLEHYNTLQNARDVGRLMEHLPFDKYNLFGVSYGTRLARVIQDLYPASINAVILNSPNPMQGDFLVDRLKSYSLALHRVLEYCKGDAHCSKANPGLKENYLMAIESLGKQPLELSIHGNPFYLNAQEGIFFIRRLLYRTNSRAMIPLLIREYENGGGPIIEELIRREFEPDYNFAMWLAVERYEMFDPGNTPEVIDEVYKTLPLLPAKLGLFTSLYLAMENLHPERLPPEEKNFRPSSVPTLITVNRFDPVTPPENGQILMEKLSNGQLFILDEGGHGGGDLECRIRVMTAFMDAPLGSLDSSCLNVYRE